MTSDPFSTPAPWELVSAGYARRSVSLMGLYSAAALRRVGAAPGAHVLDVACGPGTLALQAAPHARAVVAVDFAPAMLVHGRRAAEAAGADNVTFHEGDGQALPNPPVADGAFDAAFSMFGLMFFPDRAAGFGELYRSLKPNGRVAVSSWAPPAPGSLMRLFGEALAVGFPGLERPSALDAGLANPATLERELAAAGFRDVEVVEVVRELPVESADALWLGLSEGNAMVTHLASTMPTEAYEAGAARIRAFLAERLKGGPVTLPATANLGVGTRP